VILGPDVDGMRLTHTSPHHQAAESSRRHVDIVRITPSAVVSTRESLLSGYLTFSSSRLSDGFLYRAVITPVPIKIAVVRTTGGDRMLCQVNP
jgi:hypothetical protein